jgi:hypothetical protein
VSWVQLGNTNASGRIVVVEREQVRHQRGPTEHEEANESDDAADQRRDGLKNVSLHEEAFLIPKLDTWSSGIMFSSSTIMMSEYRVGKERKRKSERSRER